MGLTLRGALHRVLRRSSGFRSFISMAAEFEPSPRMISRGNRRFSYSLPHRCFLFSLYRPGRDLLESQGTVLIGHPHGAIDMLMDDDFGGPRPVLDLIQLLVMGYRKIISKPPFCFDA